MTAVHDLPRLSVMVGGAQLDARKAAALRRLRVVQSLSAPAQCELVFEAPDEGLAADGIAPGTSITIKVDDSGSVLFAGEVTAGEHAYDSSGSLQIRVRAHDLLHRLQKRQTARALSDVDAAAVAREVLAGSNIAAGVEAADPALVWPSLIQHDQTDFELLCEVCQRAGLYFVLREGTLHLLTLAGVSGGETRELMLGQDLLEATFELNGGPSCRRVVARAWDPGRALALEGRAETARSGRRADARVEPADVGAADERLLGGLTEAGEAHAQMIAQGELDRSVACELTLRGTAQGRPALRPGTLVSVAGVADRLAGTYMLTEVIHTVDPETGYLSVFSSDPPQRSPRPDIMSVALGKVTTVDDPEALGRVRVVLPAFGGIETSWIQVLGLGAGANKGLAILPDVDDQVLVSVVGGNLAHGIVLGGLYGSGNPDPGVEGGSVRRFSLRTSGGQRLVFDDQRRTLCISDAQGSQLEIGPEGVSLHAKVPLTIEAPGKPLVIRAATIDFEQG